MKIYMAGASTEKGIIISFMTALRAYGIYISHDWTVSEPGFTGTDKELTKEKRRQFAKADLQGVAEADLFWLVTPEDVEACVYGISPAKWKLFTPSRGCWTELGYALCLRDLDGERDNFNRSAVPLVIVISGASAQGSIFTELATEQFGTHEEAFRWICEYAQRKKEGGS